MADAFVQTFKRDYVAFNPKPDAATVIQSLPAWFEHYNALHPHRALGYRSPREFIALKANPTGDVALSGIRGRQHVPPAVAAPCFAIRRPAVAVFMFGEHVEAGIMTSGQAELLRITVAAAEVWMRPHELPVRVTSAGYRPNFRRTREDALAVIARP